LELVSSLRIASPWLKLALRTVAMPVSIVFHLCSFLLEAESTCDDRGESRRTDGSVNNEKASFKICWHINAHDIQSKHEMHSQAKSAATSYIFLYKIAISTISPGAITTSTLTLAH